MCTLHAIVGRLRQYTDSYVIEVRPTLYAWRCGLCILLVSATETREDRLCLGGAEPHGAGFCPPGWGHFNCPSCGVFQIGCRRRGILVLAGLRQCLDLGVQLRC